MISRVACFLLIVLACSSSYGKSLPNIVLVMAVDGATVRAGHDEQAAVILVHVIQWHADDENVVIGARGKGVVLMPFDRTAETRAFHIELAAEMADTRADELFEYVEHVVVAEGLIKGWMMPFGAFESA